MVLALGMLGAVLALPQPSRVQASAIVAMDLEELTRSSTRVVVAEVLAVRSRWNRERTRIFSEIDVRLAEVWKGKGKPGSRLTVVQPGGAVGDIEMRVHGLTAFSEGERTVLFLGGDEPAWVVGLGQGRRPLTFDVAAKMWMVEGGDRRAAVNLRKDGSFEHAGPVPPLPLSELRARVRELVGR